ncbi:FAD-dependent monooxygenase [Streptomyces roseolilacinus]|uniref:FAD-binding monooxygenase n=1 Tax=Streptomyces roseolilacinus TaxID=66904 RepID=A0A918AZC8_9ACTN|nr:FAD-dependent monooxygenase [Streptomyces roseolilacinus]GGP95430.1 FAD-binding monooxygenase [Streptomyces roseolilacinus]
MKVVCVGGGPAGLYLSILLKRQDPGHDITVHERNPAGSTYGWGVTYWGGLLEKLYAYDPPTAQAVSGDSVRWNGGTAHIHGTTTTRPGDEGFGIGRHRLLDILTRRAEELGVRLEFAHEVDGAGDLPDADLVVAGDGVHSTLRDRHSHHFGTKDTAGRNKYVWLGTTKAFDTFTFAFTETPHGWIWCYAYPYGHDRSTCVVECSPRTWQALDLDRMGHDACLARLQDLFAEPLDGHRLIGQPQKDGRAPWLSFRTLTNRTWFRDNLVLIGDAAHTTHYSIGAGTTLALEDAMALADSLRATPVLHHALTRYERERTTALLPLQSAARYSAQWYENLPRYARLAPPQMFALLGQRHSPLLPHVPPQLYYRIDQAAHRLEPLRRFKRWLGPRVARTLEAARPR